MKTFRKQFEITVKGVDRETKTLRAVFSTQDRDRHGDVVMQNGWDLKNFLRNPVILNSHRYGDATETVGRAINLQTSSGQLEGEIQFAVDENPKAKVIFDLYAGGFLKAFSVGFIPLEFKNDDPWSGEILKAELLEISAVSVPANAYATAKQKGVDVEALEDKDIEPEPETEPKPSEDEDTGEDTPTDPKPEPQGDGSDAGGSTEAKQIENLSPKARKHLAEAINTLQKFLEEGTVEEPAVIVEEKKATQKSPLEFGKHKKVETRAKRVTAKSKNRVLNQIIRNIVKAKKS